MRRLPNAVSRCTAPRPAPATRPILTASAVRGWRRKADKAAVFAGWKEMSDYMRDNKVPEAPPGAAAAAPAPVAAAEVKAPAAAKAPAEAKATAEAKAANAASAPAAKR